MAQRTTEPTSGRAQRWAHARGPRGLRGPALGVVLAITLAAAACTPPPGGGGTGTTTTTVPVIDPVVADHDFETSAEGWNDLLAGGAPAPTHRENSNFSTVLGPFRGHPSGGAVTEQRFDLSGLQDQVLLSFDFVEIDSWDDERFRVWVDGTLVVEDRYRFDRADAPAGTIAVAGASGRQNLGFGRWSDQIVRYTFSVPTTATSVLVQFGTDLDQGPDDESWAIDDFRLVEVYGGGTVEHREATFDLTGSTVEVYDTPFGAGNFTAPLGPGTITMKVPVDAGSGIVASGAIEILDLDLEVHTVNTIGVIGATITNDGHYSFSGPNPTGFVNGLSAGWANPTQGLRSTGVQTCAGSCGQVPPSNLGPYDDTRAVDLGAFHFASTPEGVARTFTSDWTLVNTTSNSKTRIRLVGTQTGEGVPGGGDTAIFEDFEDGVTAGWNTSSINLSLDSSWPNFTQFLGRFGGTNGTKGLHKTFPLSGNQSAVAIQFDAYIIDSWDGFSQNEFFVAFVDDVQVVKDWFDHGTTDQPAQAEALLGGEGWNLGFTAWADQILRYTLVVPTTGTEVNVGFGARLGSNGFGGGGADESWGVDNVRITEI